MTNLQDFYRRVRGLVDPGRYNRAMKMLKKDSYSLFLKIDKFRLYGIVKSQTNKELIYATIISENGQYFCGTQNLRTCGGLRGAICKHILLLLMAGIKSDMITVDYAIDLVRASLLRRPQWDKIEAQRMFSEYELQDADELEWRPVEILPEDLVAW
ncbi:MAG: hypothetical protein ACTSRK_09165 [Promethearchaeota archaeon]